MWKLLHKCNWKWREKKNTNHILFVLVFIGLRHLPFHSARIHSFAHKHKAYMPANLETMKNQLLRMYDYGFLRNLLGCHSTALLSDVGINWTRCYCSRRFVTLLTRPAPLPLNNGSKQPEPIDILPFCGWWPLIASCASKFAAGQCAVCTLVVCLCLYTTIFFFSSNFVGIFATPTWTCKYMMEKCAGFVLFLVAPAACIFFFIGYTR